MSLTLDEVNRIARLSRLDLNLNEQKTALAELNSMLGLIQELQSVNTENIVPLSHPLSVCEEIKLRLREDVVTENGSTDTRQSLMGNAPAQAEGLFLVPKVIE